MKFEGILQELENRIFKPIYFLFGDEPYFIDIISNYISDNVLNESEKSFNQMVVYGKDTLVENIDNAARRFPMMANHQVIIIKEAQNLKNIEKLFFYAKKPLKSTILVLNYKYKKLRKNTKAYKAFNKNGVVFESKKLYDNQIPTWINNYLKNKKYTVDLDAGRLLPEFLGNDLSKIANELDKLMITLPVNTKISVKDIEKNIGFSKDYNNFELHNAIRDKNIMKANRIVNHFTKNQKSNPLILTITSLYYFFSKVLSYHFITDKNKFNVASILKINPYFVKDYELATKKYNKKKIIYIISILREYDMRSKGLDNVSTTHGDLLKELVFKILH